MCWPIEVWSRKNAVPQNIWVKKKNVGPKKLWPTKYWVQKAW